MYTFPLFLLVCRLEGNMLGVKFTDKISCLLLLNLTNISNYVYYVAEIIGMSRLAEKLEPRTGWRFVFSVD